MLNYSLCESSLLQKYVCPCDSGANGEPSSSTGVSGSSATLGRPKSPCSGGSTAESISTGVVMSDGVSGWRGTARSGPGEWLVPFLGLVSRPK